MARGPSSGHGGMVSHESDAHERMPLLASSSAAPVGIPHANRAPVLPAEGGAGPGEEIDPSDFDLMLSRSVAFSTAPILEPEPIENAMLRGPRRYSVGSSPHARRDSTPYGDGRRRLSLVGVHRAPSVSSEAVDEDDDPAADLSLAEERLLRKAKGGTLSGADSDEDAPLLGGDAVSKPRSPFLNGISVARFWVIFSVIMASYFIGCFDSTIMASSHPVITSYFGASNSASWLSTAFLLASTAFQPLMGRLSDTLGRKALYIVVTTIFAFATLWCAVARSMSEFIAARAMCGLGAGGMMALGSILVSDLVPIDIRGAYQSYTNIAFGVGSMLGVSLGGAMADALGWRWEFGVQVLPIFVCVGVATVAIPSDLGITGPRESLGTALRAFDFQGSILLIISVTCFVLGLNLGGNVFPWSHPVVLTSLAIFAVSFPPFLYVESKAARPIMPLHLLCHAPRANLIFSNAIASFLSNAIMFNIPLYFQAVLLTTATESGLRLVLPSFVSSLAGTVTGFAITATRRLKWPVTVGVVFYFLATIVLTCLHRDWPAIWYPIALVPFAVGQGFQFPGTFMALLAVSTQEEQAVVTSTLILWRSVGTVLGISISSLVVQNALFHYLHAFVQGPERDAVISAVRRSVEAIGTLRPEYREQVVMSYEAALRWTFVMTAAVALVSVALILPIKLPRLGQRK